MLALANKITKDPVPPIPKKYPGKMLELIKNLLSKDPEKRPSPK